MKDLATNPTTAVVAMWPNIQPQSKPPILWASLECNSHYKADFSKLTLLEKIDKRLDIFSLYLDYRTFNLGKVSILPWFTEGEVRCVVKTIWPQHQLISFDDFLRRNGCSDLIL